MTKPYHEILRESARVEVDVINLLERTTVLGGASRYYAALEALAAVKAKFYGYVNSDQPHLAEAVLSGYGRVLGPMPLETRMCDRLLSKAANKDASWDFAHGVDTRKRDGRGIRRMSWAAVLPAQFSALAQAIDDGDAAANIWPIACLMRASTDKGLAKLRQIAATALEGMNSDDTSREGFAQQFERIHEALLVTLNARDDQAQVEGVHAHDHAHDSQPEAAALERQRG